MSKIGLGWMAWEADGTNGYAHIAEKFHYHLLNDERFNFVNAYSEPWDALICVATPARFTIGLDLVPRRDIVFHTMFEAQPLPPGWIDVLNCAGMLWVPSKYSADLFHEAGVKTPTFIAGYGVAHREYTYIDRRQREVERGAPEAGCPRAGRCQAVQRAVPGTAERSPSDARAVVFGGDGYPDR